LVVESDLSGLSFDSNDGIVKRDQQPGRDFLFLSAGERLVTVFKTGYRPLKIILAEHGIRLASGEVWQVNVTGDQKMDQIPISIVTDPSEAGILIDGVKKGTSRAQQAPAGKHTIRVEKEGYKPQTQTVDVSPSNILFSFKLEAVEPVAITITSQPTGAKIILNGADRGETDKGLFLFPSTYALKLQKSGCVDIEKQITVSETGTNTFSSTLTRNSGTLTLTITPQDARVLINKEDFSARTTIDLAQGRYKIDVSKAGYVDTSEVLDIVQDQTIRRSYTLWARTGSLMVSVQPLIASVVLKRGGKTIETWQGMKQLKSLPMGEYELETRSAGYTTDTRKLTITDGKSTSADVTLKKTMSEKGKVSGSATSAPSDMIFVEGGSFDMGSNDGDDSEKPLHRVEVGSFYMDKCEVTQAEYEPVMGKNPSNFKCPTCPVENVSWSDATEYATKVGKRLPTEAEWEYAARGGKKSKGYRYSGSNELAGVAWYSANSRQKTHPVGQKKPNEIGLYDMSGNVWEWCSDWYISTYYEKSPKRDPQGPGSGTHRVLRGGSWKFSADICNVKLRSATPIYLPAYGNDDGGFRCVQDELKKSVDEKGKASGITTSAPSDMILVEGGSFDMGSNVGESNEKPVHRVTLASFYLDKYEVTQAEYERVMGKNPSSFKCPTCPVEQVSWNDAVEYARKVGKRLPTEAEWEYAARGGNKSRGYTYSGNNTAGEVGWYHDNSERKTHPVGGKQPNELGLYDMSGNVWEWCADWYDASYQGSNSRENPRGPDAGQYRVLRGGSWDTNAWELGVSCRLMNTPSVRYYFNGFRCSQDAK
jgi:formylglycine-generating enzyme required for sulfatase activity